MVHVVAEKESGLESWAIGARCQYGKPRCHKGTSMNFSTLFCK